MGNRDNMTQKTLFGEDINFFTKMRNRTKKFHKELVQEISNLKLEDLTINPYIIAFLFKTPKEFINFFFYQSISRKTSGKFGKYIEDLLLYLSDGHSELPEFDLKKIKNEQTHHVEIKSFTNTMRKAEMKKFFVGNTKSEVWGVIPRYQKKRPNECFKLGTSYGELTHPEHTRSIKNYIKRMLDYYKDLVNFQDEKNIHLCGTKLWDFFSGEENFLENKVFPKLLEIINKTDEERAIIDIINEKIETITKKFIEKYQNRITSKLILDNFI